MANQSGPRIGGNPFIKRSNVRIEAGDLGGLVTRHMRLLSSLFADAHLEDINARVASRILAMAHAFGVPGQPDSDTVITVSQTDLGLMLGVARQTVNRVIQQFQKQRILSVRPGHIVIHSLAALQAHAHATRVARIL